MIGYESFKEEVTSNILAHMPDEFEGAETYIYKLKRAEVELDVMFVWNRGSDYSPGVCLNEQYKRYLEHGDVGEALKSMAAELLRAYQESNSVPKELYPYISLDQVIFTLMNSERRRKLLEETPYREFLDLSVVYRVVIRNDEKGFGCLLVNRHMMEYLGVNEEQLFRAAYENTKRILPVSVYPIIELIQSSVAGIQPRSISDEELRTLCCDEMPMLVITNQKEFYGDTVLLYPEILNDLASKINADLILLPSSTNEILVIPAIKGISFASLESIVRMVNANGCVEEHEVLSDRVYYFSRATKQIGFACDQETSKGSSLC